MERKYYKEVWGKRFKKMLTLETQSVLDYEKLLLECRQKFKGHAIEPILEKLITDEKRHALLVQELTKILQCQPD